MKTIYKEEYKILIDCLKRAREHASITQVELAARIGCDQSYVSRYERRERRLDIIEVQAICNCLNVKLHEFISTFENELKKNIKENCNE